MAATARHATTVLHTGAVLALLAWVALSLLHPLTHAVDQGGAEGCLLCAALQAGALAVAVLMLVAAAAPTRLGLNVVSPASRYRPFVRSSRGPPLR